MGRKKSTRLRAYGRLGLTALAAVMIGASAWSWVFHYGVRYDHIGTDSRSRYSIFVANGRVWTASQAEWILDWENEKLGMWGMGVWSSRASVNLPMTEPYFFGMDPYLGTNAYGGLFTVQYATGVQRGVYFSGLLVGGLIGLSTVPSWVDSGKRRYRLGRGCCLVCGYSLEGLTIDVCPECGVSYEA